LIEYNFLMKIPNVEQYLLDHCLEQIMKRNWTFIYHLYIYS
jgi:hypothetical protein